ncbi:hypothetical protein [Jiangella endophytica]|nr:hypothetical protein [Jiangella endophytica]
MSMEVAAQFLVRPREGHFDPGERVANLVLLPVLTVIWIARVAVRER